MRATLYDPADGRIHMVLDVSRPELLEPYAEAGMAWVEGGADARTQHVADGAVGDRPAWPDFAEGPAPMVYDLSGMPAGTSMQVEPEFGAAVAIDMGEDLLLATPGTYTIRADLPFPWLPFDQVVTIT